MNCTTDDVTAIDDSGRVLCLPIERTPMTLRPVVIALLVIFASAACGGSDGDATVVATDPVTAEDIVGDTTDAAEDLAEDLTDSLETAQAAAGGGSATLTVGDQTWTFEPVLCAFGPEQIGQEGAEFVLSSLQDGMQMYFSIDSYGQSASINDVKDFANPSVSVSTLPNGAVIAIDGKNFSGTGDFYDDTTESFETVSGTFSGTCP